MGQAAKFSTRSLVEADIWKSGPEGGFALTASRRSAPDLNTEPRPLSSGI